MPAMTRATGILLISLLLPACATSPEAPTPATTSSDFKFEFERFGDIQMLAYEVPGFDDLPLRQKTLIYYLYQASYAGRDIMWDQNYRYNLRVRRTLEAIVNHYPGERKTRDFEALQDYTRRVWFANGIHHHNSTLKLQPTFSEESLRTYVEAVSESGDLPLLQGETVDQFIEQLTRVIFDPSVAPKKVATEPGVDKVAASAVNFYRDVSEADVRAFYAARADSDDLTPVSHGLNSQLVKDANGNLRERVWRVGGMYGEAIEEIVFWLERAIEVTENDQQKKALELLIRYYRSGDLKTFDDYSVAWVEDTASHVDLINGFIEVYNDPIAYRGSYESIVSFRDIKTDARIATIGANAQWFEDHMPIMAAHKRDEVKGILGKAITVVAEAGDASPNTPVGINLPNANWIRANHGSKSVTITNVFDAYYASPDKALQEFAWDDSEIKRARAHRQLASALSIDMHEVIGHASGRINPGVGETKDTLKQYASTLEEARADLVALYYIMDTKLIELDVMPDLEVGRAAYDRYIRNGLMTQMYRIPLGGKLEEAHMRNRALVAGWAYDKGQAQNIIERKVRANKTYFVINDYDALRGLFADLLRELQRIKSEGDFDSVAQLVEAYGTHLDAALHAEVLQRYAPLDIAPYRGFVNPLLSPVYEQGEIVDVELTYPESFDQQMLHYAAEYSYLPPIN